MSTWCHRERRRLGGYYGSMDDYLHVRYHVQLRRMQQLSDDLNLGLIRHSLGAIQDDDEVMNISHVRSVVRRHEASINSTVHLQRDYEETHLD